MALAPGSRLGPYLVSGLLGQGGMGEAYRARDSRLDRDVAIKVLPAAVAEDAERVARFDREARTLASLNHPNVGAIHGLEESDGMKALVLELVEGPTLADRLAQGAIPIAEALPIAFLMMREGATPDAARPRIVHVQHWVEELTRLVPVR